MPCEAVLRCAVPQQPRFQVSAPSHDKTCHVCQQFRGRGRRRRGRRRRRRPKPTLPDRRARLPGAPLGSRDTRPGRIPRHTHKTYQIGQPRHVAGRRPPRVDGQPTAPRRHAPMPCEAVRRCVVPPSPRCRSFRSIARQKVPCWSTFPGSATLSARSTTSTTSKTDPPRSPRPSPRGTARLPGHTARQDSTPNTQNIPTRSTPPPCRSTEPA